MQPSRFSCLNISSTFSYAARKPYFLLKSRARSIRRSQTAASRSSSGCAALYRASGMACPLSACAPQPISPRRIMFENYSSGAGRGDLL